MGALRAGAFLWGFIQVWLTFASSLGFKAPFSGPLGKRSPGPEILLASLCFWRVNL